MKLRRDSFLGAQASYLPVLHRREVAGETPTLPGLTSCHCL